MTGRSLWTERAMKAVFYLLPALVVAIFVMIIGDIIWHGLSRLSWSYLVAEPERAGRAGGIGPILLSTFALLTMALAASVPLAVATAVYLAEFSSPNERIARAVRQSLEVLSAVPSIVF